MDYSLQGSSSCSVLVFTLIIGTYPNYSLWFCNVNTKGQIFSYENTAVTELSHSFNSANFPGGSEGKASAYNVEDLGSIPVVKSHMPQVGEPQTAEKLFCSGFPSGMRV